MIGKDVVYNVISKYNLAKIVKKNEKGDVIQTSPYEKVCSGTEN